VVLGGRAPQFRWGAGSLQEIDHLPLVAPVTKHAATIIAPTTIPAGSPGACRRAHPAPRAGFLDLPLEVIFSRRGAGAGARSPVARARPDEVARAAALLAARERPVIIAGSDVYAATPSPRCGRPPRRCRSRCSPTAWARALPPEHPLAFAQARKAALTGADVVCVVGTPLDFRLGFGDFGAAQVVHIVDAPSQRPATSTPAAAPAATCG
jgi:acetolactate synthase-1/2/3 large subunit